jgi:hypothetical protein
MAARVKRCKALSSTKEHAASIMNLIAIQGQLGGFKAALMALQGEQMRLSQQLAAQGNGQTPAAAAAADAEAEAEAERRQHAEELRRGAALEQLVGRLEGELKQVRLAVEASGVRSDGFATRLAASATKLDALETTLARVDAKATDAVSRSASTLILQKEIAAQAAQALAVGQAATQAAADALQKAAEVKAAREAAQEAQAAQAAQVVQVAQAVQPSDYSASRPLMSFRATDASQALQSQPSPLPKAASKARGNKAPPAPPAPTPDVVDGLSQLQTAQTVDVVAQPDGVLPDLATPPSPSPSDLAPVDAFDAQELVAVAEIAETPGVGAGPAKPKRVSKPRSKAKAANK